MGKTLYIITLEPLEQRYTKQWHTFWKDEFSKYYNVVNVDGYAPEVQTTDKIETGRFLDVYMTNVWKSEQVKTIALWFKDGIIKSGDIFLFMDAWHFGVTAVKYMAQLSNTKVKVYGYWHAGSYDPADFITQAGVGSWAGLQEASWLFALDGSFVATQFHKDLMVTHFGMAATKNVHVVGFPMNWKKVIEKELGYNLEIAVKSKKDLVVFPHRLDKEKRPEVFDNLAKRVPHAEFVKTLKVTKNKREYYQLLRHAKVVFSASKQETFGIGTVEAMMLGAVPVVPNELSYKELYDDMFKYSDLNCARDKVQYVIHHYGKSRSLMAALEDNRRRIYKDSLSAIPKMARTMG